MLRTVSALASLLAAQLVFGEALQYQKPPKPVLDALNALPTPMISVSPQHNVAVLMQAVRYAPIAEVAQPMLRLAGIRIDTDTNGLHLARTFISYTGKRLNDGSDIKIPIPGSAHLSTPVWSPDGKHFAFTNTTANGIDLYVADASTGASRRIPGVAINGVIAAETNFRNPQEPIAWLNDNHTLLARTIVASRGTAPAASHTPQGPHAQENLGHAGPAPTYEDLLSTPHDEDLFDYYATAQLAYVDIDTGRAKQIGKPGIFAMATPSPDGQHILVGRLHRPSLLLSTPFG